MSGAARVLERLEQLYAIGGGPGANRIGLSAEEQEAHALVAEWMVTAGLAVEIDSTGNLVGRLLGTQPHLPEVWSGSHLDSVPAGGCFDGALGVVAALEAVERVGESSRTLAVVAFRDEEGSRFANGCFGSRAMCGRLGAGELDLRDGDGVSIRDALAALGLPDAPPRAALEQLPACFLELHVEQGPVLERAGAPLGIVTGIVGVARGSIAFEGRAAHAGTTPMDAREDALCAAAELVLRARDVARESAGTVATVGQLRVEPGAPNVVPERVLLTVDARAPDRERLEALLAAIGVELPVLMEPVTMAPEPIEALRAELERLGLTLVELASGAGHDAGILAAAGVPTAMLFVRSLNGGASHSPAEETSAEDIEVGVEVLTGALTSLAAT